MKKPIPRIIPDPAQMTLPIDDGDGWGDVAAPARRSRRPRDPTALREELVLRMQAPDWAGREHECKAHFGFHCAGCNHPLSLQAHHRTYVRLGHERPRDLTCFCDLCHRAIHTHGGMAPDRQRRAA